MDTSPVAEYYAHDHDRLEALFREFQGLKRTDMRKAKDSFRGFFLGLRRHIVWEEEILFPLFETRTGLKDGGPTSVMRLEHRQIKAHLDAIHEKVRQQDPESDAEEAALLEVLTAHNQKEEQMLYPAIDGLLTAQDRQEVFTKMERITPVHIGPCCGEP